MALSAKQRKQNQIERDQERLRKLPDSSYEFLRTPFHLYLEDDPNWSSVTLSFDLMGIEPPVFEDDRGPTEFAQDYCFSSDKDRDEAFPGSEGSIGRAEIMVNLLNDAAIELSSIINSYKRRELAQRRKELETADLSDPEVRREAMDAVTRITRIEDELNKNIRRTLPQWQVKVP